jgi:Hg(II)-responsive transcriptional regulator
MLTVGRLAQAAGVNVETIRYYEKRGLIARPAQPASGYRKYGADDVARVQFIKSAQRIGFTLNEISELIRLEQDQHAHCSDLQERAEEKVRAVDQKIAELQRMRAELVKLAVTCPPDELLARCDLLNCFSSSC